MGVSGGKAFSPGKLKLAKLTSRSSPPQFRLEASNCLKKSIGELPVDPLKSLCKLSNRVAAAAAATSQNRTAINLQVIATDLDEFALDLVDAAAKEQPITLHLEFKRYIFSKKMAQ